MRRQTGPLWRLISLLLALAAIGGCATATMSPARRQRISECLKQCDAVNTTPTAESSDPRAFDPRRDCERRCHQMK